MELTRDIEHNDLEEYRKERNAEREYIERLKIELDTERNYIERLRERDEVRVNMDSTRSEIVKEMTTDNSESINGWDESANQTINNWFEAFKEYRWIYQYILDRNYTISTNLILLSVIGSSMLSFFSGFKLWNNNVDFQNTSNIIMLISNGIIAGVTTMSKRYIDDSKNEVLRLYIENCDKFIGSIYAQVSLAPIYRMKAEDFFNGNNKLFTELMTTSPSLSLKETTLAKNSYSIYGKKSYLSNFSK